MVVGGVEITAVTDAVGVLGTLDELYPQTEPAAWASYRERYPELFAGDSWRIPCTCYLLRAGATTILVDTGVGPPGLWDWDAEREGALPELVDRKEVDVVFLTHTHVDHVGWNTDASGRRFFPRARYVLHADALAAAVRLDRPHIARCIAPIDFETVGGEAELAPNVVAFPLPGHSSGHMGVRVGDEAVLIGDAAVHPALLEHAGWLYVSDGRPEEAAATRRLLLPELEAKVVVCGHYPGDGIGRVVAGKWQPL